MPKSITRITISRRGIIIRTRVSINSFPTTTSHIEREVITGLAESAGAGEGR